MGFGTRDAERVLSRPLRVYWRGWETTTTRLQQGGWELAVNEEFDRMTMRMTMRHQEHRMYGVSRAIPFDFIRYSSLDADLSGVAIEILYMGSDLVIQLVETNVNFHAIDAVPQYTQMERKRIEDFGFFATPLVRTNELIVDPTRIGEILEQIKLAQLPEQEAIRKRALMRERSVGSMLEAIPRQQFHAQVLSLVV